MRHFSLLALMLELSSCTSGDSAISANIAAEVSSSSSVVDLAKVGPPSWNRVCILGAYSTTETAEPLLGTKWNVESHSSIGTNEGIQVLVFLKGHEVLAFAEHRRALGDFVELEGKCLSRSQAVLFRKAHAGEWVHLVPR
jgi:hypothetical protein